MIARKAIVFAAIVLALAVVSQKILMWRVDLHLALFTVDDQNQMTLDFTLVVHTDYS